MGSHRGRAPTINSWPGDANLRAAPEFELVINLKTAKTLRLTIPPSLLLRADQVVE
jgi:putative tryptophan/tyrosine transport system substrate-binding protein